MIAKERQEFIKKWSAWWCLQKQGKELTIAFEQELNELIENANMEYMQTECDCKEKTGCTSENVCNNCGRVKK